MGFYRFLKNQNVTVSELGRSLADSCEQQVEGQAQAVGAQQVGEDLPDARVAEPAVAPADVRFEQSVAAVEGRRDDQLQQCEVRETRTGDGRAEQLGELPIKKIYLEGTSLAGTIPGSWCNTSMEIHFDCSAFLCGCSCPCTLP